MTTTKPIAKMNLKELRAAWMDAFGRTTESKDADGLRAKLADHAKRKATIQAKAAKPAKPTAKAKAVPPTTDPDRITAESAANVARACEENSEWSHAAAQWVRAGELAASKRAKADYAGKAAAARTRAEVKSVIDELAPAAYGITRGPVPPPPVDLADVHRPTIAGMVATPPPATSPAAMFVHDPRVLARCAVGETFTYENKSTGVTHHVRVVASGFEYLGPVVDAAGKTFPRLGGLLPIVKGAGSWNAFLVFGFGKTTPRAPGDRAERQASSYGAAVTTLLHADWWPPLSAEYFAALVGAAAGGDAGASGKLDEFAGRCIAALGVTKVMAAAATRAVAAIRASAEKETKAPKPAPPPPEQRTDVSDLAAEGVAP